MRDWGWGILELDGSGWEKHKDTALEGEEIAYRDGPGGRVEERRGSVRYDITATLFPVSFFLFCEYISMAMALFLGLHKWNK